MKTCHVNVNLFPIESGTFNKIQNNCLEFRDLDSQNVMIRTISSAQWKQIAENPLTEREFYILEMITHGKSNLAIAQELYIAVGTVKTHVRHIFSKLKVRDRAQATVLALRSGLVD